MNREIDVCVTHSQLEIDPHMVVEMVTRSITELKNAFPTGDVSIAIMNDADLAKLHEQYLDDPTLTDVITFPGDETLGFAGEICISADRARSEGDTQQTGLSFELSLYLVHGLLHLAGWNDKDEHDRLAMRNQESKMLGILEREGLLPVVSFRAQ